MQKKEYLEVVDVFAFLGPASPLIVHRLTVSGVKSMKEVLYAIVYVIDYYPKTGQHLFPFREVAVQVDTSSLILRLSTGGIRVDHTVLILLIVI